MATEVVNVPDLDLQFFGNDGKPLASGYLKFFRSGTDIPAPVYTSDGETALGNTIELDASGFPNTQFSLKAGQLYTVKAFDSDDVLIWTRNDISGSSEGGGAGNWVPIEGTSLADPMTGPLVMKYDDKTTTLDNDALTSDTAMQMSAPTVGVVASDGAATILGVPRVSINAVGEDSAQINIQSDKKIELQGSQIEIKAPNSGNEITINSKGLTEIIGGITNIQGNNGISLATTNSTNISCNGPVKFLGTATLNNKTVSDIWTSSSTGTPLDSQLITAKAAYEMSQGGSGSTKGILIPFGNMVPGWIAIDLSGGKTFCVFGRTALRNCTIKKVLIGTFAADASPQTNELGIYAMRSNRALTLLGKTTNFTLVGGGEMLFDFTTPISVGDEIIFLGHLCSACYLSTKLAYIRTNTNGNMSVYTTPSSMNTTFAIDTVNTGSRIGFVWRDRTLQSLPASTTPSDWDYNFNYIPLPYTEVFYE